MGKEIKEPTLEELIEHARVVNDVVLLRQLEQIEKETDLRVVQALTAGLIVGAGTTVTSIFVWRMVSKMLTTNLVD